MGLKKTAEPHSKKTFNLRLSTIELVHLRDLFSILLPPEAKETVSQSLALVEDRQVAEVNLWQKIVRACDGMGVSTADKAPDFLVACSSAPPVSVYRIAEDKSDVVR